MWLGAERNCFVLITFEAGNTPKMQQSAFSMLLTSPAQMDYGQCPSAALIEE